MIRRLLVASAVAASMVPVAHGQAPATAPTLQAEYAARRAKFAEGLPDGVILVLGGREPEKEYLEFFQSPSLHYLTGFREPNAALVMVKKGSDVQAMMFVQPRNPAREAWTGARMGTDAVARVTGMRARDVAELFSVSDSLLAASGGRLHLVTDPSETPRPAWLKPVEVLFVDSLKARVPQLTVNDVTARLQQQRAVKSPSELALLRRAIDITVLAHREAARAIEPGMNEFEISALIEYTFRRNGADRPGFASIVGSGPNATTLHYIANDRFMQAGETVVIDIGSSYRGYSADVTRTYPVSGTFTPEQRAVYQVVRDAQEAAARQVRPGGSAQVMRDSSDATLARGLAKLGLIDSVAATFACSESRRCSQAQLFTIHGLSHGIGLEVHDPEAWYFTGTFGNGSVFTIEPGIYVRANLLDDVIPDTPANAAYRARLASILPKYRNIGVRIEDDYAVTDKGAEWLSKAPREIAEIEALMKGAYAGPAKRDPKLVEDYRKDVP